MIYGLLKLLPVCDNSVNYKYVYSFIQTALSLGVKFLLKLRLFFIKNGGIISNKGVKEWIHAKKHKTRATQLC
ncbi:hypothetical protein D7V95_01165 [bacterium J10(2018)]|nr:hypothetical protein D7V95_01165 [bacterium J10(2018)]